MRVKNTPNKTQGVNNPSQEVAPDLFVGHYGYEICSKNKDIVDSSYPSFRLHYVIKGGVVLYYEGKKVVLKRHSVFILMPSTGISYGLENKNIPTELYWVTFNGYRAKHYVKKLGLSPTHPYTVLPDGKIEQHFLDNFKKREYSPSMLNLLLHRNLLSIFNVLYEHRLAESAPELNVTAEQQSYTQTYMQKILYYIDKHMADPHLSIRMFAEKLNVHPSTLSRLFKKEMSICFTEYLTLKRIEYAVPLLEEGKLKVNEVARMVGFEDALYFSRIYKKQLKCSPMDTIRKGKTLKKD